MHLVRVKVGGRVRVSAAGLGLGLGVGSGVGLGLALRLGLVLPSDAPRQADSWTGRSIGLSPD